MRKHKGRDKVLNDKEPIESNETNQNIEQIADALVNTSIRQQQPVVSASISSFEQEHNSPTRSASSPGTYYNFIIINSLSFLINYSIDSEAGPSSSLNDQGAVGGKKKSIPFLSSISSAIPETNLLVPSTSQCPIKPKQVFVKETDNSRPKPTSRKKYSAQSGNDAEKLIQNCIQDGSKRLDLTKGSLTVLPPSVKDLTHLTEFYLYKNKLTCLPNEIGNLVNLKKLAVNENSLTSLPDTLANLKKLEVLDLRYEFSKCIQPRFNY